MDWDPTLAFTAVLELHPGGRTMTDADAKPWREGLLAAFRAENPKDRYAFAREWIADKLAADALAEEDAHGQPYGIPHRSRIDYRMALAISRSAHPSRVLANTAVYRYGRFTATPWCAVCSSAELSVSHTGPEASHAWTPAIDVTMMGSKIATFHARGVTLYSCGYKTVTTADALSNLVTGGYFYHDNRVLHWSAYATTGSHRTGEPAKDGAFYPYV